MDFQTDEIVLEKRKPKKKKRRIWPKVVMIIFLVAALVGGYYAYNFYSNYQSLMNNLNKPGNGGVDPTTVGNLQTEPFAIMVLGEGTNNLDGEAGADSISLLVINPQEKTAKLIGVPRDSYLPRANSCDAPRYYDKITNSGTSIQCLQDTLENVFDLEINYYVSINFVSFVKIVDTLGGVQMNVPDLHDGFEAWSGSYDDGTYISSYSSLKDGTQWCEHDSMRNPYAVCFKEFGVQTVNGEQALALARSRHYDSDFARSERQMELIKAIVSKATKDFNILTINSLLEAADGNIKTNISESQFIDFAKLGKNLLSGSSFSMQSLQLDGAADTFAGELGTASYNKVSIFSIEDIRMQIAETLAPTTTVKLDVEPFYFDPTMSQYAAKYGNYHNLGYLEDYMDVTDEKFVRKYNTTRV